MKKYIKHFITGGIGLLIALLVANSKDLFTQTEPVKIFHILTDAFTVPGVLFAGVGLVIVTVNGGSVDMLAYGMRSFFNFFKHKMERNTESFYDYRKRRESKKMAYWYLLIVGLIYLGIALIMYYFYSKNYIG